MGRVRVLILHATGTNRDRETAWACEAAGGEPEIVHVNQLLRGERRLANYHMLILPGGFSYGDALGAGRLWAVDLRHLLGEEIQTFIESGRPVLGICNGFQALVKAGWLPGPPFTGEGGDHQAVTLTYNASGHFECRWVWLQANPSSPCVFTRGLSEPIYCPVAHGEGRFVPRDEATLQALQSHGLIALTYVAPDGGPARYPWNPNGSVADVAGICNLQGNVLGLMPHPEDHIVPWQHPRWMRGESGGLGLALFAAGIHYAASL
ncbi:MAG: phosphoribosylformylglycinamidine synthase I [Anaerolineae bacterium]|nr:phosphoribosylformylglycinamidine synthase I [Anaerolineae bacterium]MDW8067398.1 phosphoribosylformylglycinamidine synthase I [Anaerolineae bacterium]